MGIRRGQSVPEPLTLAILRDREFPLRSGAQTTDHRTPIAAECLCTCARRTEAVRRRSVIRSRCGRTRRGLEFSAVPAVAVLVADLSRGV